MKTLRILQNFCKYESSVVLRESLRQAQCFSVEFKTRQAWHGIIILSSLPSASAHRQRKARKGSQPILIEIKRRKNKIEEMHKNHCY